MLILFSSANERRIKRRFKNCLERKIKEQSLALELEKIASKQYILEEYLNAINLGEGTLGVQTASQKYFNKDVSELTLSECAVLASITKNPTRLNPVTHPENNASRRLLVFLNLLQLEGLMRPQNKNLLFFLQVQQQHFFEFLCIHHH